MTETSPFDLTVRVRTDDLNPTLNPAYQHFPFSEEWTSGCPVPPEEQAAWHDLQQRLAQQLPEILRAYAPTARHEGGLVKRSGLTVYLLRGDATNMRGKDDRWGTRGIYQHVPELALTGVYGRIVKADRLMATAVHELGHHIRALWRGSTDLFLEWVFEEGLCENLVADQLGLGAVRHARLLSTLSTETRMTMRKYIELDSYGHEQSWSKSNDLYSLGYWTVKRLLVRYSLTELFHFGFAHCFTGNCPDSPTFDHVVGTMQELLDEADEAAIAG